MATKSKLKAVPGPADASEVPAPPAVPARLRTRLLTIGDVKKELARLYREARAGQVDSQAASRLANMLSILGRLIEGSDLERRLEELEKALDEQGRGGKKWAAR